MDWGCFSPKVEASQRLSVRRLAIEFRCSFSGAGLGLFLRSRTNSLFETCKDNCSVVFIEQANDVVEGHFLVQEEIADRDGSLGLGIER